jgi:uncharacterized protein YjiS (DUF1127 family)
MTVTTFDTATGAARPAIVAAAIRAATALADFLRRQHAIRYNRRILEALPDRMLSDMGISRSEIDSAIAARLDHAGRPLPGHGRRSAAAGRGA